jgi:hypothetical protein
MMHVAASFEDFGMLKKIGGEGMNHRADILQYTRGYLMVKKLYRD